VIAEIALPVIGGIQPRRHFSSEGEARLVHDQPADEGRTTGTPAHGAMAVGDGFHGSPDAVADASAEAASLVVRFMI